MPKEITYPAYFSDPKGEKTAIFESPDDVPTGWTSGAEKQTVGKASKAPKAAVSPPAGADLDAHGHAYDPALHAATKSKTSAGLWRMRVGVKRPDPAPGYPLDL